MGNAGKRIEPALIWAAVGGILTAWAVTSPILFNGGLVRGLIDVEPFAGLITMVPSFVVYKESHALALMLAPAGAVVCVGIAPSVVYGALARWTAIWIAVVACVFFLSGLWLPSSQITWWVLFLFAAVSAFCVSIRWWKLRWLAAPLVSANHPRKRAVTIAVYSVGLFTIFYCVPFTHGKLVARSFSMGNPPSVIFLLHMKDRSSVLHEELVDILIPEDEYLVVRMSDQVPHPQFEAKNPEGHQEKKSLFPSIWMPILVHRDSVEAIIAVVSPAAQMRAWGVEDVSIQRTNDGGYELNIPKPPDN